MSGFTTKQGSYCISMYRMPIPRSRGGHQAFNGWATQALMAWPEHSGTEALPEGQEKPGPWTLLAYA